MKKNYLIILFLISVIAISGCSKNNPNSPEPLACTEDAKICADGTAVARDPENNCEFPSCPDEKTYVSENPEECMVIKFMCSDGKKPFFDEKGCGCEPITEGKLKAIDCTERPQACTKEYMPVCGQVQVQCIKAPCPPIMQTFGNKCEACANSLTISYTEGACPEETQAE